MKSIEATTKQQFSRVFQQNDWTLFKKFADFQLKEAALLRKRGLDIEEPFRLLARNSRKRLLIGVGVELLLKAAYLKHGFRINKRIDGVNTNFPWREHDIPDDQLNPADTFTLGPHIDHVERAITLAEPERAKRGLKIAKVFRNKEGHVVTPNHAYDRSSYLEVAFALESIYCAAFSEKLTIVIGMEPNQRGKWAIRR